MSLSPSARLEALLFAEGGPITKKQLSSLLGIDSVSLAGAILSLGTALESRGLALIQTPDEVELRTSPLAADVIRSYRESELARDLGKASLETLAIILYRGTATRTEIDWVRGVNSGAALRTLLLRGLIERTEDAADKRRARYHATVDALAHLGISSVADLPRFTELHQSVAEVEERATLADTTV
jgi:segregation and condensation protein B